MYAVTTGRLHPRSHTRYEKIVEGEKTPHAAVRLSKVNTYSDPEVQGDQLTGRGIYIGRRCGCVWLDLHLPVI